MFFRTLNRLWTWLTKTQVRLEGNFPWTLGKSLKTCGIASLFYLVGTVVPMLLMSGLFRLLLSSFPELFTNMSE